VQHVQAEKVRVGRDQVLHDLRLVGLDLQELGTDLMILAGVLDAVVQPVGKRRKLVNPIC
jgi:hypothetical protein